MAKTSIALAELVEKGSQDDVVRELLGHVVERATPDVVDGGRAIHWH